MLGVVVTSSSSPVRVGFSSSKIARSRPPFDSVIFPAREVPRSVLELSPIGHAAIGHDPSQKHPRSPRRPALDD